MVSLTDIQDAISKAAIRNHSKNVALSCAEKGNDIRCDTVHPAVVMMPMWAAMISQYNLSIPIGAIEIQLNQYA